MTTPESETTLLCLTMELGPIDAGELNAIAGLTGVKDYQYSAGMMNLICDRKVEIKASVVRAM